MLTRRNLAHAVDDILRMLVGMALALAGALALAVAPTVPALWPPSSTTPSERPDHGDRQLRELLLALSTC